MSLALPWVCHWIFSVPGVALHFQKRHVHLEDALPAELLPQLIWPTILGITHLDGIGHQKEHSATQRPPDTHTGWRGAGTLHAHQPSTFLGNCSQFSICVLLSMKDALFTLQSVCALGPLEPPAYTFPTEP